MFVLFVFWSSGDSLCLVFFSFKPMTLFYLHLGPSVLCCACFFLFFSLQLGPGVSFYCIEVPHLYFCVCVNSFWLCISVHWFLLFADWSFLLFFRGLGFFLALQFSPGFCFNHIQVLCTSTMACMLSFWTCCLVLVFLKNCTWFPRTIFCGFLNVSWLCFSCPSFSKVA